MELNWHIGDVIGKVREMRGKNRGQLASDIGMSAYSMGQIEKTGNCRKRTLERIAQALNVPVGLLYENIPRAASMQAQIGCCKDHENLFRLLKNILHGKEQKWKDGIIANLEAMEAKAVLASPPDGPGLKSKDLGFSKWDVMPESLAKKKKKIG